MMITLAQQRVLETLVRADRWAPAIRWPWGTLKALIRLQLVEARTTGEGFASNREVRATAAGRMAIAQGGTE